MMKSLKLITNILLAVVFAIGVLCIMPVTASAEEGTVSVEYVDENGDPMGSKDCILITSGTTGLTDGWYAVTDDVEIPNRIMTNNNDVNIILCDGAKLKLPKGIDIGIGSSLKIYGQEGGDGQLVARNDWGSNDAAIGSSWSKQQNGGSIHIRGGKIDAVSNGNGAAIGGCYVAMGNVTIAGGEVTATANGRGAAIGSGAEMGNAYVTITGGKVNAFSYNTSACAIGGTVKDNFISRNYTYVTITGGEVNATAANGIAAIGSGNGTQGGTITIKGGKINATANNAAAIGCPGVMSTLLTYEEGNSVTSVTSSGYSGKLTLGVPFHDGSGLIPPGDTRNEQVAGKTITAHTEHDFGSAIAAVAPSYDASTHKYSNGTIEHYACAECGQIFLKEDETYRPVSPEELLVPYFEFGLVSDESAVLTGYNGTDADIVIPDTIPQDYPDAALQGKPVKKVGWKAFYENETIRKVTAGDTIDTIDGYAFAGCPNLETASFGTGVELIGGSAFYNCEKMTKLAISSRKSDLVCGSAAFAFSNDLTIYGHSDSIVKEIAHWEEVPFLCLDAHQMRAQWRWTVTGSEDGIKDATVTFDCMNCDLHEEVQGDPGVVLTPATCTVDGEAEYSVHYTDEQGIKHDETVEGPITAFGHKYKFAEETTAAPTCTTNGSRDLVAVCERCGSVKARRSTSIPALGHEWGGWNVTTPAGCEEEGVETRICRNDPTHTETREVPATGHDWSEWTVTAGEEGTETRTCANCGRTETRPVPASAHQHQLSKVNEKAATCAEPGNIEYYICSEGSDHCDRCFIETGDSAAEFDDRFTEIDPADTLTFSDVHTWDDGVETTEPTCSAPGVMTYTCTVCGETKEEPVPMTEHVFEEVTLSETEATCTEDGHQLKTQICSVCGESTEGEMNYVDALGHSWGDWVLTKEATPDEEGVETRTCARCGESETRAVPFVPVITKVEAKGATCSEAGNIEYYVWSQGDGPSHRYFVEAEPGTDTIEYGGASISVNEVTRADVLIRNGEHDWVDGDILIRPSCTTLGHREIICSICRTHSVKSMEMIDHDPVTETEVIWEPLCEDPGYSFAVTSCSVCHQILDREFIEVDPIGHHTWAEEPEVDIPATHTETGVMSIHCTVCGASQPGSEEEIPKLPPEEVRVPSGKTLTFNGKVQTGVATGTAYTITGNTATNAGSYTATLSLKDKDSYTWADGTTEDQKVSWKIAPKKITPAVKLSASSYTWNGKVKKPTVTVKDGNTKLAASQYTVTYKNNKNVGKASAVVTLKGNYTGSKTVSFKIKPKGTSLSKLTKAKKAVTVKWKKQSSKMSSSRITGYQILLATDSKFTKNKKTVTVKGYSKVSKKVKGLKGGKKYYVKIRTYKTISRTKNYSPWSKAMTVTTKK